MQLDPMPNSRNSESQTQKRQEQFVTFSQTFYEMTALLKHHQHQLGGVSAEPKTVAKPR
jgi:hypothetical protein